MITIIAIIGAVALLAYTGLSLFAKKWLAVAIPLVFAGLFAIYVMVPNYLGYSVDSEYVNGKEAIVLQVSQMGEWYYLLVRFTEDEEPRLVRVPATESNKDKVDQLEGADEGKTKMIRFGANSADLLEDDSQAQGSEGNQGNSQGKLGEGKQADPGSFGLVDMGKSETFRKE